MKLTKENAPLGKWADVTEGYWMYPILEGQISNKVIFKGKELICWSYNDYLGIASHQKLLQNDVENVAKYGLTYPMGSRVLSGDSIAHRDLEKALSAFTCQEESLLLNMGYQGMFSIIDALLSRADVLIFDAECHACTIDGARLHKGLRMSYTHNDMCSLRKCLKRATMHRASTNGTILVISEGVFSMRGDQGKISEIVRLKDEFDFTFLLDDAHGFGVMGRHGSGTHSEHGLEEEVDLYFATFTKALASSGAFISGSEKIINFLKYSLRSQIFSRSIPLVNVLSIQARLEYVIRADEARRKLKFITRNLHDGLTNIGYDIGDTNSCITPIHLSGNTYKAMAIVEDLREQYQVFCSMVSYPVVPRDKILLRLIPTANHNLNDVENTISAFRHVATKIRFEKYDEVIEKYMVRNELLV